MIVKHSFANNKFKSREYLVIFLSINTRSQKQKLHFYFSDAGGSDCRFSTDNGERHHGLFRYIRLYLWHRLGRLKGIL